MKSKKYFLFVVIFFFLAVASCLSSCFEKKIQIASDYLINENWGKDKSDNHVGIQKMRVKKDSIINLTDLNQNEEFLSKLEDDTSFVYTSNVEINSSDKKNMYKIFFNKDNGFYWWTKKGEAKTKIIGNLEKGSWYKFSDLEIYNCTYFYVFIDSLNNPHQAKVNSCNY